MNNKPILKTNKQGDKYWILNEKYHREDGPAFISGSGDKYWYVNGLYHREDGPAIIYRTGTKEWYLNGKRHREDGPAYKSGFLDSWWKNGQLHRVDGPAVIYSNKYVVEWWLENKMLLKDEWFKRLTLEQQYNYLWKVDEE